MKKQLIVTLVILASIGLTQTLQAQLRYYPKPVLPNFKGAALGKYKPTIAYKPKISYKPVKTPPKAINFISSWGGLSNFKIKPTFDFQNWAKQQVAVNMYGKPSCCCDGRPCNQNQNRSFRFELTFNDFANLIALENAMLAAQWAAIQAWLKEQEETLRKEINERLRSDHKTFEDAQRAFFEDRSGYAAAQIVKRKESIYNHRSRSQKNHALESLTDYKVLDDWINCGYCKELEADVLDIEGISKYDALTGVRLPPHLTAKGFRDSALKKFNEMYYASGENRALTEGYTKLDEDDLGMNNLVDEYIEHYNKLAWDDKIVTMSGYLTPCTSFWFCTQEQLKHYKPLMIDYESKLANWAKEKAPKIPYFGNYRHPSWRNDIDNPLRLYYIFSDEWLERRLKYVWGRKREERKAQIRQAIMQERQDIMNNLLKQPKTWYFDQDGDRYHGQVRQSAKRPGAKWTLYTKGSDCGDNNPEAHTLLKWYKDNDGDGYHAEKVESCGKPNTTDTWVNKTKGEDCDDNRPNAHWQGTWYKDQDYDGYYSDKRTSCGIPQVRHEPQTYWRTSRFAEDCDDTDKTITKQPVTWYLDNDDDGYHSEAIENCGKLGDNWKRTTKGEDCDDNDSTKTTDCEDEEDCNTFEERVKEVLNTEGGFVNDPVDSGGATNRGISWPVWLKNAQRILGVSPTLQNLKNLTEDGAKSIYKELYWDALRLDEVKDGDLRFLIFDFNVNSGEGNAVRVLQRTINQLGGNVSVDGAFGSQTLNAINNISDQVRLYNDYKNNRNKYLKQITKNNINRYLKEFPQATETELKARTYKRFINGWLNRVNSFKDKTDSNSENVNCD